LEFVVTDGLAEAAPARAFARYLCSAEAELINGAALPMDGGRSAA